MKWIFNDEKLGEGYFYFICQFHKFVLSIFEWKWCQMCHMHFKYWEKQLFFPSDGFARSQKIQLLMHKGKTKYFPPWSWTMFQCVSAVFTSIADCRSWFKGAKIATHKAMTFLFHLIDSLLYTLENTVLTQSRCHGNVTQDKNIGL